jgi:hypothetical protein
VQDGGGSGRRRERRRSARHVMISGAQIGRTARLAGYTWGAVSVPRPPAVHVSPRMTYAPHIPHARRTSTRALASAWIQTRTQLDARPLLRAYAPRCVCVLFIFLSMSATYHALARPSLSERTRPRPPTHEVRNPPHARNESVSAPHPHSHRI